MKTKAWLFVALLLSGALTLQGFGLLKEKQASVSGTFYPVAVKKIIDQKCYGCHSEKGQSQDAKDALMWDDLAKLEKAKLIANLDVIIEVLEDGVMPPEDAVKKYPQLKMSDEETKVLKAWASAKADSLLN